MLILNSLPSTLNIGLTEEIVEHLKVLYNERFALTIHWIFIQSFGIHIIGMKSRPFREIINRYLQSESITSTNQLSLQALQEMILEFKTIVNVPQDPYEQVSLAIQSIYKNLVSKRYLIF